MIYLTERCDSAHSCQIGPQSSWNFPGFPMSSPCHRLLLLLAGLGSLPLGMVPLRAQVLPSTGFRDLGTTVSGGSAAVIQGGTQRGGNLFHSFQRFDLPPGSSASFDGTGTSGVQAIFGRIESGPSKLDGSLGMKNWQGGTPHLTLMNPFGFIVGSTFSTSGVPGLGLLAVDSLIFTNPSTGALFSFDQNISKSGLMVTNPDWSAATMVGLGMDANAPQGKGGGPVTIAAPLQIPRLELAGSTVNLDANVIKADKFKVLAQGFNGVTMTAGTKVAATTAPSSTTPSTTTVTTATATSGLPVALPGSFDPATGTFVPFTSASQVGGAAPESGFLRTSADWGRTDPDCGASCAPGTIRLGSRLEPLTGTSADFILAGRSVAVVPQGAPANSTAPVPVTNASVSSFGNALGGGFYRLNGTIDTPLTNPTPQAAPPATTAASASTPPPISVATPPATPTPIPAATTTPISSPVSNTAPATTTASVTTPAPTPTTTTPITTSSQPTPPTRTATSTPAQTPATTSGPVENNQSPRQPQPQPQRQAARSGGSAPAPAPAPASAPVAPAPAPAAPVAAAAAAAPAAAPAPAGRAPAPAGPAAAAPPPPPAPAPPTAERMSSPQAAANFERSEQSSSEQVALALGLSQTNAGLAPSTAQVQSGLREAIAAVRNGGGQRSAADLEGLGLRASANPTASLGSPMPAFNRNAYNPAVLHLRYAAAAANSALEGADAHLDLVLISANGEPQGLRLPLRQADFREALQRLYGALSRQEPLQVQDPSSPARSLYRQIFAQLQPLLQAQRITTLLISADQGLQAIPYAALHDGEQFLGERYGLSLTPSLNLTNLQVPLGKGGELLALGASQFQGLAPLPLVPEELRAVAAGQKAEIHLNGAFTPAALLVSAAEPRFRRVHVATHAEFLPGGPSQSRLYTGEGPIPLRDFASLRSRRQDNPLDLISLSACRTALGDADSELGFAGLALQAGARSAIGSLWYVDDVATSAFFVQTYRHLEAGIPKAEALQLTRQAFSRGLIRLEADQVVGANGEVLLAGLNPSQRRLAATGLGHPYFWGGIQLLGSPW